MAAITATTPPMMMPNVPLLSLFIVIPTSAREVRFLLHEPPIRRKSLQKLGHFVK